MQARPCGRVTNGGLTSRRPSLVRVEFGAGPGEPDADRGGGEMTKLPRIGVEFREIYHTLDQSLLSVLMQFW